VRLDLEIIRASEFIRVGAHGKVDLQSSRETLSHLAGACRRRGIQRALLDLRHLHPGPVPMLSRSDLAALVSTFHEVGFTKKHRLALLYNTDPHHRARMFAFLTTLHGGNVKACDDFEQALSWLCQEQSGPSGKQSEGKPIPLHFVDAEEARSRKIQPRSKARQSAKAISAVRPRTRLGASKPTRRHPRRGIDEV
jgi:hypothetical protein